MFQLTNPCHIPWLPWSPPHCTPVSGFTNRLLCWSGRCGILTYLVLELFMFYAVEDVLGCVPV
jgi:hypothetical protein